MNNIIKFPSEKIRRTDPVIEQTVKKFMTVEVDAQVIEEFEPVIKQHARDVNKMWDFIDKKTKLNIKKHIRENTMSLCYKYFSYLLTKRV